MNLHQHIVEEQILFEDKFSRGFCGNCDDTSCHHHASTALKSFLSQSSHRTAEKVIEIVRQNLQEEKEKFDDWALNSRKTAKLFYIGKSKGFEDAVTLLSHLLEDRG